MPTPKNRPIKVFLCHARTDADRVRALYHKLKRAGVDVWLDKEKLIPGSYWDFEIRKAVREADVVVVCLSKQFTEEGYRQQEVRIALDAAGQKPQGEIFIIPARLEECENPESLSQWQWVDLFEEDGYKTLMRALKIRADRIGATMARAQAGMANPVANEQSAAVIEMVPEAGPAAFELQAPSMQEADVPAVLQEEKGAQPLEETRQEPDTPPLAPPATKLEQQAKSNAAPAVAAKREADPVTPRGNKSAVRSAWLLIGLIACIGLFAFAAGWYFSPLLIDLPALLTGDTSKYRLPLETSYNLEAASKGIVDSHEISMIYIPAGEFIMGSHVEDTMAVCNQLSTTCADTDFEAQSPAHMVNLPGFYMDVFEVTNSAYADCVEASVCDPPTSVGFGERTEYYGNPEYDDYPVILVTWTMANKYCEWRGARLPTEAEWEKAARGVDHRPFPWGTNIDCSLANTAECVGSTSAVGAHPGGRSIYGIEDLAGNVWEWVYDIYDPAAYSSENPGTLNFDEDDLTLSHVVRGGSWNFEKIYATTTSRGWNRADESRDRVGFRCAKGLAE